METAVEALDGKVKNQYSVAKVKGSTREEIQKLRDDAVEKKRAVIDMLPTGNALEIMKEGDEIDEDVELSPDVSFYIHVYINLIPMLTPLRRGDLQVKKINIYIA